MLFRSVIAKAGTPSSPCPCVDPRAHPASLSPVRFGCALPSQAHTVTSLHSALITDGVDIAFYNNRTKATSRSAAELLQLFRRVEPRKSTPTASALFRVLDPYISVRLFGCSRFEAVADLLSPRRNSRTGTWRARFARSLPRSSCDGLTLVMHSPSELLDPSR